MTDEIFSKGIGNKEGIALEAKPVQIQGIIAEEVKGKVGTPNAGKVVGRKLVLICKHPDKEETIKLSTMVLLDNKTLKTTTIWINVDADGLIQKGSHVATLLEQYKAATINDLVGKLVLTAMDGKFLAIKAY
jgi:type II secretory pathway predicted ATPase ExeA